MSESNNVGRQDWTRYVMVFNKWDDEEWHFIESPCIKGKYNFLHQKELNILFEKGIIEYCIDKIKEANPSPLKDIVEISFYCDFITAKDVQIIFKHSREKDLKQDSSIKSSGKVLHFNAK